MRDFSEGAQGKFVYSEGGGYGGMGITTLMEPKFRGDIRFRGAAYIKAERVTITHVTADRISAVVSDGVGFETHIDRSNGEELHMYCTCFSGEKPLMHCKHLWATLLAVESEGLIGGTVKPGHIPPFAADPAPSLTFDTDWEDDWDEAEVFGGTPRRSSSKTAVKVEQQLPAWAQRLQEVSDAMQVGGTVPGTSSKDREIFFEIDVAASEEANQLVIQTSQRERRANGQWGKLKPLKLRSGQLDEVEDEEDRKILAYLAGSSADRGTWHARQAETQSTAFRYLVPYELCGLVLPMICASGHGRYLHGSEKHATALKWDEESAWELCLDVRFDDENDQWRVDGSFQREGDEMPVREPHLIVPGGYVFTETSISEFRDYGVYEWVRLLRSRDPIAVPNGQENSLVDRLFDMPLLPRLTLPEELRLEEVRCAPQPRLILRSPRGVKWQSRKLQGEVFFDYDGTHIRATSPQGAVVQRAERRCIPRDRHVEERAWKLLTEHGFRRLLDHRRRNSDVEINARNLGPAVRVLVGEGWIVEADGSRVHQPVKLGFQIKSGIDWFELHADVDFDGRSIDFPDLLSALSRGDSTVRLDDGSLGILPEEWIAQYGLLAGLGTAEEDHVRFSQNQVGILDALLSVQEDFEFDQKFDDLRSQLRDFSGIDNVNEPDGFTGELRTYQREGLGWLRFLQDFSFGGCLADDMGLGKTIQFLALLQDRKRHSPFDPLPSLVVVPKSLIFNWKEECQRFTPELSIIEYIGLDRADLRDKFAETDLILTTYGTLRRDILELKDIQFDYVVLDEAQAIKNAGSQVAKASRLLRANHRLALSGTPIENHVGDLWSIFEFLNPGMLGRASVFKLHAADSQDAHSRKMLSQALKPFILRRTKNEVAKELPDKLEQTIHCDMGSEQRKLYDELREHYRASLLGAISRDGLGKTKMHVLEALLRLRQAACHPALLDRGRAEDSSAKLDALFLHLEELLDEGHKALVFSQFTSMLSIVRSHLDKRGVVYEYLDGQTRNRQQCVDRFQNDPKCPLFLISLKAGGFGLNLTAADYVFLLDPWWNPAVESQAIDRTHRIGQTKHVFAYRLICRDTVEEKIAELQNKKKDLADAILQADNNLIKSLTIEDLKLLLS